MLPSTARFSRSLLPFSAVALAFWASCSVTDGAPSPASALGAKACVTDLDCGSGRHCAADATCAIDCVTSKDCVYSLPDPSATNDLTCSLCGRCVKEGTRDSACLGALDQPCEKDQDCTEAIGAGYACNAHGLCARTCATQDDCTDVGRGYGCGDAGLCVQRCSRDRDCLFFGWNHACSLPEGTDPVANAESCTPVYGECVETTSGTGFTSEAPSDPPSAAYQGVWGALFTSAARVTGTVLPQIDSSSVQHVLLKINWDGADLRLTEKWCAIQLLNFNENDGPVPAILPTVVVPDLNVDSLLVYESRVVAAPELLPGATFDTDELLDVRGAKLPDPENDALPTALDLTSQWDQDCDEHPGLTVKVTGSFSGEIYQAQRTKIVFHPVVVDADHLQGLVSTVVDVETLGASSGALENGGHSARHPQDDRTYIRLQRLPDDASCSDVITLGQTPGSWLEYQPHYDATLAPR